MVFPFKTIHCQIIPHGCMRDQSQYGDYWTDEKGVLHIRVSEHRDPNVAFSILIHEIVEAWRCARKGIDFKVIDKFDLDHADHPDPGLLPEAPYHAEHVQSMEIEYLMARQDGRVFADIYNSVPIGVENT